MSTSSRPSDSLTGAPPGARQDRAGTRARPACFGFVTLGGFSGINDAVLERMRAEFPGLDAEQLDVRVWVRSRRALLVRNLIAVVRERGPRVLLDRTLLWGAFWRTSLMQRAIRDHIRELAAERDMRFTFQTQSLFDASTEVVPHYVYTDHSQRVNERYPDYRPEQAQAPAGAWLDRERLIYHRAAMTFTMSNHVSRSLIEQYGVASERVRCVGAGSNTIPPAGDPDYESRRVVFVGRDWERKGGPDLLAAFGRVRAELPDATLTIVGCGPEIAGPGVRVLGEIPPQEVAREYARSAVFCMPTLVEPFGIVFVEALTHGLPVVASDVGAVPDVVRRESGFLHAPHDHEAIAASLIRLLGNPELARQMGTAGRADVALRYTWLRAVGEMASLIRLNSG